MSDPLPSPLPTWMSQENEGEKGRVVLKSRAEGDEGGGVKGEMQTCPVSHFLTITVRVCVSMHVWVHVCVCVLCVGVSPPWRSAGGLGSSDRRRSETEPHRTTFQTPGRSPRLSPSSSSHVQYLTREKKKYIINITVYLSFTSFILILDKLYGYLYYRL